MVPKYPGTRISVLARARSTEVARIAVRITALARIATTPDAKCHRVSVVRQRYIGHTLRVRIV
eukprot:scaffold50400_cov43-Prasinocladus_malaysianus.AAC.1